MKTKNKKRSGHKESHLFLSIFLFWVLFLITAKAGAEPRNKREVEITPGPRMIRAVEALANDYLAAREALKLSPEQEEKIRQEAISFKKDIWRKEAVLIGIFQDISLKRRHGLLSREEYQATNQVTGGIETDELGRLMKAVTALQEILTPAQREAFRTFRRPQMSLEMPEGVDTRLGLMVLRRWGRVYGEYRDELDLSEPQAVSLRTTLEEARREFIRIGTDIEISRMEAYDLLKEPVIDPKKTREAMERTGRLEGIFFSRLSEIVQKLDGTLTRSQRVRLEEIRKEEPQQGVQSEKERLESVSPLDRADELVLSRDQIEKLVALETAAMRHKLLDQAELQIQNLELEERIREGASEKAVEEQINRIAQLVADMERDRLQTRVTGMKILNEKQKMALRMSLLLSHDRSTMFP